MDKYLGKKTLRGNAQFFVYDCLTAAKSSLVAGHTCVYHCTSVANLFYRHMNCIESQK